MKIIFTLLSGFILLGCASSTEQGAIGVNRNQLLLVPSSQIEEASAQSYEKLKQDAKNAGKLNQSPESTARVQNVMKKLIPQTAVFRKDALGWKWESNVITQNELNAFCMPGGKIIFYTGIIDQLKLTDGEIAAIMGHEISHALREHGRERMTEELIKKYSIDVFLDPKYSAIANTVSTLAISLPHGRNQETEADEIGLELMARAGYDPLEAISLWRKMSAQNKGGQMPQFLSTHPTDENRIKNLQALMPKMQNLK
jgi:Zn-dependent protease with chaperone function